MAKKRKQTLEQRQELMKQRQTMGWQGSGRPPKFLPPELVYHYASEGYSDGEIAAKFAVSIETLRANCGELLDRARAPILIAMRLAIYELAMEGYFPAMRFLMEYLEAEKFPGSRTERQSLRKMAGFLARPRTLAAVRKLREGRGAVQPFRNPFPAQAPYASVIKKVAPHWVGRRPEGPGR